MVPPVWQLQLRLLRAVLHFGVGKLNFLCDGSGREVPVGLLSPTSWKSLNGPDLSKGLRDEAAHISWFCSSFAAVT